jgi:hypothetical protein
MAAGYGFVRVCYDHSHNLRPLRQHYEFGEEVHSFSHKLIKTFDPPQKSTKNESVDSIGLCYTTFTKNYPVDC